MAVLVCSMKMVLSGDSLKSHSSPKSYNSCVIRKPVSGWGDSCGPQKLYPWPGPPHQQGLRWIAAGLDRIQGGPRLLTEEGELARRHRFFPCSLLLWKKGSYLFRYSAASNLGTDKGKPAGWVGRAAYARNYLGLLTFHSEVSYCPDSQIGSVV